MEALLTHAACGGTLLGEPHNGPHFRLVCMKCGTVVGLVVARTDPLTCPICGGIGHGARPPYEVTKCIDCDGTGVVPAAP
jgi:rRNA maturation endonuclease Nob1